MKRFQGGTTVRGGYYWHVKRWEIATIEGEAGVLEGDAGDAYLFLPIFLVPLVALLMAAACVMFTPTIGFVLTAKALAQRIRGVPVPVTVPAEDAPRALAEAREPAEVVSSAEPVPSVLCAPVQES